MMDNVKDKAEQATGEAHEKKDEAGSYVSDKTGAVKEKAEGAAQATKEKVSEIAEKGKETAQAGKEKTGGILQKTGEQVKSMAQGAADAVKNTLGMAKPDESEDNKKDVPKKDST